MTAVVADDGCRIQADCLGDGPPLLLIAGLGGLASFWEPLRPALGERFRVAVFDHRGTGSSDRPEHGPYTIERIAADARRVLDHYGIGRAHILGHSTGGAVAQALALDTPGRVDRLVLSGTWERPDGRFRRLFAGRLALLLSGNLAAYQALTHALGYPAAWIEAHDEALTAAESGAAAGLSPVAVAADRIRMLLDFDRSADLGRISAPTLVLAAEDDAIVPPHHARRLAALIPGAALELLTGGHFFPRTEPAAMAAAVVAFLTRRPP